MNERYRVDDEGRIFSHIYDRELELRQIQHKSGRIGPALRPEGGTR